MVGSDTDLDYLDRAARHFDGMALLKREGEPYDPNPGPEQLRAASYPPVHRIKPRETYTATEALQAQELNEASLEQALIAIAPNGGIRHHPARMFTPQGYEYLSVREHNLLVDGLKDQMRQFDDKRMATIKAKDEIIAGLQDDIKRLLDMNAAEHRRAEKHKADSASLGALQAKLAKAEEESRNLHDRLMHACEELDRLKNGEPDKPSTCDMSRLGHFGESHAKNGLSLFDRYY